MVGTRSEEARSSAMAPLTRLTVFATLRRFATLSRQARGEGSQAARSTRRIGRVTRVRQAGITWIDRVRLVGKPHLCAQLRRSV